jgi:hypothetical protein
MATTRKVVRFQRILNDMLAFPEEQLELMIRLGQKVLRAKRTLKSAATEAQQFADSLGGLPGQQALFPAVEEQKPPGSVSSENVLETGGNPEIDSRESKTMVS